MPASRIRGTLLLLTLGVSSALALTVGATGCDRDTDVSGTLLEGGNDSDAMAVDAGPAITVTTRAPTLPAAAAAKVSATWAAYRLDDGAFRPLAPAAEGTYRFPLAVARWTIALVCASPDDALVSVALHHRTNATPEVDVTLDESCSPLAVPPEYAFIGSLMNIPTTTQWFDFGYARTSRGEAIPVSGSTGTYEIVGIDPGTWDLSFAVRDEPFLPLTRFVFRRGVVVNGDTTIDIDFAGPGSFTPGSKALRLRGLLAGDTVAPVIFYGAGGPVGIDVGPQDVPDQPPDVELAYSTVPSAAQVATDRYHGALKAEQDRRTGSRRIAFDFHEALDLDLAFLPDPPVADTTVVATTPSVRFKTKFAVLPNAERHEVIALAARNRRTQVAWRATYDARNIGSAAMVDDVTPDLAALPGWKAAWGLPVGVTTSVFVIAFESPQPLGDGTMQRSASKGKELLP